MNKILFILFVMLQFGVYAQDVNLPCNEVIELDLESDSLKNIIIRDFIQKSLKEGTFNSMYDKGIVLLYDYTNEKGEKCWYLGARIDNSYEENPPEKFCDFKGDIVLIFDADSAGRPLPTKGSKEEIINCLRKIVGDRVFINPKERKRWTNDKVPIVNRVRSEGNRRMGTGGAGDIIITFSRNNKSYRKSPVH